MTKYFVSTLFLVSIIFACTRDTFKPTTVECTQEVNYADDLKEILDRSCASTPACHKGNPSIGDYTTYDGISIHFNDLFKQRTIDRMDMPPAYAEDFQFLTEDEFVLLSCWVEQNFPEN